MDEKHYSQQRSSVISNDLEEPLIEHRKPLSVWTLAALIFFEVAGSPAGIEPAVEAAGPLFTLIGFSIMPFIWSVPESLVTAELSTMFPEDGGFVSWVSSIYGEYWGYVKFFFNWLSSVTDNAIYPLMIVDYFGTFIPALEDTFLRVISLALCSFILVGVNLTGLELVGRASVLLVIMSLLPFLVMVLIGIPDVQINRCSNSKDTNDVDWGVLLNTLFWNLNYFDSASALAAEVQNPTKTFPKALQIAVILIMSMYIVTLVVGIGVTPDDENWEESYFSRVAEIVGGQWLKGWVVCAVSLSSIGMFEAELSTNGYLVMGMSRRGMLPAFLSHKTRFNTPLYGILISCMALPLSIYSTFQDLIEMLNLMYIWGSILAFSAFIAHRIKRPDANRPFKIPLNTIGVCLMLLPTLFFTFATMYFGSWQGHVVSFAVFLLSTFCYYFFGYLRRNNIIAFFPLVPWTEPLPSDYCGHTRVSIDPLN